MGGASHVAKGLGNKDDEEKQEFKLKMSKIETSVNVVLMSVAQVLAL